MIDEENFNDISIRQVGNGIEVKLGNARAILLNRDDAQFLCDNLYILLDDMELEEALPVEDAMEAPIDDDEHK